jgi:hypothetical protein
VGGGDCGEDVYQYEGEFGGFAIPGHYGVRSWTGHALAWGLDVFKKLVRSGVIQDFDREKIYHYASVLLSKLLQTQTL